MSDGTISQSEIDALLSGVDMGDAGGASSASSSAIDATVLGKFVDEQKDKLTSSIGTMTGTEVKALGATAEVASRDLMLSKIPEDVVAVIADFTEGLKGDHLFVMSPELAQKIVSLVNKEESPELDDMALSVISEVVQNHVGAEITALSAGGKFPGLAAMPPETVHSLKAMIRVPLNSFALLTYTISLEGQDYNIWEAIGTPPAEDISKTLGGKAPQTASPQPQAAPASSGAMGMPTMQAGQPQMMGGMQMSPQMMNMGGMQQVNPNMAPPNVQQLQFPSFQGGAAAPVEQGNIGLIMDVFMEMTVELGRTKKPIKEILGMGEGTIIELDKLAGEPVDILVNHKKIAKGEVVVIDENFGVRVTEILSPNERVS